MKQILLLSALFLVAFMPTTPPAAYPSIDSDDAGMYAEIYPIPIGWSGTDSVKRVYVDVTGLRISLVKGRGQAILKWWLAYPQYVDSVTTNWIKMDGEKSTGTIVLHVENMTATLPQEITGAFLNVRDSTRVNITYK